MADFWLRNEEQVGQLKQRQGEENQDSRKVTETKFLNSR